MDIKSVLRQLSQGSQVPPERQVSEADMAQVGEVAASPEGMKAGSEILKGASIPAGFIPGIGMPLSAGMYAGGVAMDPDKTMQQKLSPGNAMAIAAPMFMGSMGKVAGIADDLGKYAGLSDDVAAIAGKEGLSKAEAIMLQRKTPVREAMQSINKAPTAIERQLQKKMDAVGPDAGLDRAVRESVMNGKITDSQDIINAYKNGGAL
jgi:hypothetical protein